MRPARIFEGHVAELRHYAARIRRAVTAGHRLGFTAEPVLKEVQAANLFCVEELRHRSDTGGAPDSDVSDVIAVLAAIDEAMEALRARMIFGPL